MIWVLKCADNIPDLPSLLLQPGGRNVYSSEDFDPSDHRTVVHFTSVDAAAFPGSGVSTVSCWPGRVSADVCGHVELTSDELCFQTRFSEAFPNPHGDRMVSEVTAIWGCIRVSSNFNCNPIITNRDKHPIPPGWRWKSGQTCEDDDSEFTPRLQLITIADPCDYVVKERYKSSRQDDLFGFRVSETGCQLCRCSVWIQQKMDI